MKIAFIGDIAFYGKFCQVNNSNLFEYFSDVKKELSKYDFVVGNLETPLVNDGRKSGSKSAYIFSKVCNVELLSYLGVNIVNLANNHIFDYGVDGYLSTKKALEQAGISWFGTEDKSLLIEHEGEKLAFHGYCSFNTNPLGVRNKKNKLGISPLDVDKVIDTGRRYQELGYLNIISVHSGIEHINYPSLDDVNFARKLSEIFPYVYYGHHPHVLQGIEKLNKSLIAYSLGNFCFDDVYDGRSDKPIVVQGDDNKSSIILSVEINGGEIKHYNFHTIFHMKNKVVLNDSTVSDRLSAYSQYLTLQEECFLKNRAVQISSIVQNRNSKRDLEWALKRLNFSTLQRIYELYLNKAKYKALFKNKLKDITGN
tara:strand:- start:3885 stop:4988 length:1104 start_codon:yes stop_codon:yes gene_type:complete